MIYVLEGDTPWGSEFSLRAVLDKYIYIYMDSCSYRVSMDMFNPLCFWQSLYPILLLVPPLNT